MSSDPIKIVVCEKNPTDIYRSACVSSNFFNASINTLFFHIRIPALALSYLDIHHPPIVVWANAEKKLNHLRNNFQQEDKHSSLITHFTILVIVALIRYRF